MGLKQLVVLCSSLGFACLVAAGEVRLVNGDRLAGELESIGESNILWKSDTVGTIQIPKDKIQAITSTAPLKIRGRDEPCHWQELRGSQVIFACANGDLEFEPLYSLKKVVPYIIQGEGFYEQNGRVAVQGNRFSGNIEQEDWSIDTEWMVRYSDVRHTLAAEYASRSFEGSALDEQYQASYAFDWFFKPRGYWQNEMMVMTDETLTIQERYAYGSGLGYEFWRTSIGLFAVELGLRYEKTLYELIPPFDPDFEYTDEVGLWRGGVNFTYGLPLEIRFQHRTQYFQALDDSVDWRLESETGFLVPLGFGISANITYEYDFNNDPPEQSIKRDSVLRFGVDYSW